MKIPQQRAEVDCRVSADLTREDFAFGDCVYMRADGSVTMRPNGGGQTNPFIGRCLGPGKIAATVVVLTEPLLDPGVVDAVTQLGDLVR